MKKRISLQLRENWIAVASVELHHAAADLEFPKEVIQGNPPNDPYCRDGAQSDDTNSSCPAAPTMLGHNYLYYRVLYIKHPTGKLTTIQPTDSGCSAEILIHVA